MQLNQLNVMNELKEKQKLGYPKEECFVEVYAYALTSSKTDPLDFISKGTRKVLPLKGKVFYESYYLHIQQEKNGKLLKKKIYIQAKNKASIKIFSTKESFLEEYKKDKQKIVDLINQNYAKGLAFQKEIDEIFDNF